MAMAKKAPQALEPPPVSASPPRQVEEAGASARQRLRAWLWLGAGPAGETARKAALALADQFVYGATSFVTTILLARAAGGTQLGLYSLGLSLALVGLDLQNSLILIPYTVFSPRLEGAPAQARLAGGALLQTLALGGVSLAVLAALASPPVRRAGLVAPGAASLALALAVPLMFLRQHVRMVSFARLELTWALAVDLAVGGLQLAGLFALVRLGALTSAPRAFLVTAAACALGFLLWLAPRRGALGLRLGPALVDFRRNWQFSRWLITTTPVAILRSQLALWLLTFFHGPGAVGLYAACLGITSLANPLLTGAGNLIGSKAAHIHARQGRPALRRFILQATGLIGLAMALFLIVILLGGDRLVRLVYGGAYAHLGTVVSLLAAGVFIGSLSAPAYRGLLALERSGAALVTELLMFLFQASAGLWLVARHGLTGAALAVLLSGLIGTAYQLAVFLCKSRPDALTEGGI